MPRRHRRPKPPQAHHQNQPSANSATPATQNACGCHQVPRLRATPAMQNESRCCQVPRLPRETKVDGACVPHLPRKTQVDITKCQACHVKRRWMSPSAMPARQNAAASPATKTAPSAPPDPPCSISATLATQNAGGCHQVPRLPRETKVNGACVPRLPRKMPRRHRRPKPPQARHQSQPSAISATPATQNAGGRHQVPRLPRETKVDGACVPRL